jgi:hypothetical protein
MLYRAGARNELVKQMDKYKTDTVYVLCNKLDGQERMIKTNHVIYAVDIKVTNMNLK